MAAYAPTLDSTLLLEGPAHLIIDKPVTKADWKYCWCQGNVTVHLVHSAKDMPVSGWGNIDDPRKDEVVEVDFTPAGNLSAGMLAFLFSGVFALKPGQSVFSSTDRPIYVHTLDGKLLAITRAAVVQFPAIRFGAGNPRFEGSAKLVGVLGKGLARTAANALFTAPAAEDFTATPTTTDWVHLPCKATWDLATDIEIMTDDNGWTLRAAHTISPRYNPDVGTYDYRVDAAAIEASCRPVNVNDATLISAAIIGSSRALGQSSISGSLTLIEDNPGLSATLLGARLASKPMVYGENEPRAGELTWRAYPVGGSLGSVAITAAS